jgi:DNA-binding CsgD family transcriptional regulator
MINDNKVFYLEVLEGLSTQGFSIGVNFLVSGPTWVHSTYQQKWIDHYVENGYMNSDPTIHHGIKYSGHFIWSDLEYRYPEQCVFAAAKAYGMPNGNTLSFRINGISTIISSSGAPWNDDQLREAYAAAAGLHFLHAPKFKPSVISNGVVEVLVLMKNGMRDQAIADTLGVKIETVRKRRATGCDAAGVENSYALLSVSIQNGWI